jgi:hypothetical protein
MQRVDHFCGNPGLIIAKDLGNGGQRGCRQILVSFLFASG